MFVRHDPSFDGLLSAAAWCLRRREERPILISGLDEPLLLQASTIPIESNIRSFFLRHYAARLGQPAAKAVLDKAFTAWLSEQDGIASRLYRFLYLAWMKKTDPAGQLQDPDVAAVVQAAARVGGQAHQYLGLLRFRQLPDQLYLAEFEPDYHVLPLILPHFVDRLPDQPFVICDRRRRIAAWYQPGRGCTLHILEDTRSAAASDPLTLSPGTPTGQINRLPTSAAPAATDFEQLWRRYLQHLTIPERRNLKLQQANMPQKYWRYMTENPFTEKSADGCP